MDEGTLFELSHTHYLPRTLRVEVSLPKQLQVLDKLTVRKTPLLVGEVTTKDRIRAARPPPVVQ